MRGLPPGSKTSFAFLCGFATRRRLWAVARFNAYLTDRVAARLIDRMDAVECGDLVPVSIGRRGGCHPRLSWQLRASERHFFGGS